MSQSPRRLSHSAIVSAADYNALLDIVETLREQIESPQRRWPITASFPIEVRRHPGGVHLSLAFTDRDAVIELTSSLSGGGSRAKVLWLDGAWKQAEREEITVYDVIGTMEGNPGDKALAKFHRQSGRWLVWQLQC